MEIRWKENAAVALEEGKRAGICEVVKRKSFWIITHTEVDPAMKGQGIAGKLLEEVMRQAGKAGVKVKPFCSYAVRAFQKNPSYQTLEDHSVITIYGMESCPDCQDIYQKIQGNPSFVIREIGEDVSILKEFLVIRDRNPVFDSVKGKGIGIPCFVFADGTVTLDPEEAGLFPDKE